MLKFDYLSYHKYTKAAPRHLILFLILKKIPYLNQVTQKNTCQIFQPKKIPESKISNPNKSFDHPCHLQAGVAPLGLEQHHKHFAVTPFSSQSCLGEEGRWKKPLAEKSLKEH